MKRKERVSMRSLVLAITKAYHNRGLWLGHTFRYNYKTKSFWREPIRNRRPK